MQTQERDGKSNGVDTSGVIEGAAVSESHGPKPYYFDKTPLTADVPWPKDSNITLRVTYNKPQDSDHDEYEAAVVRKVETVNGESSDKTDAELANRNYFDAIVVGAEKFRRGEDVPFAAWDRDKCLSLPDEVKTTIIVALGQFEFELVGGDDDELLFSHDNWKVRQFLGKTNAPEFEIFYELKPLAKTQRDDYGEGRTSKDKPGKKKTITTVETTFQRKARKLFAANFISVDKGGQLQRGEYDESLRSDYITQIDSSFKLLVIDTMVTYYRRGRD